MKIEKIKSNAEKLVRCYDNGGETFDRYTVCFVGNYRRKTNGEFIHLAMSEHPAHPQGFGQHGGSREQIDKRPGAWGGPAIGRKCHLGKRVTLASLPEDCRKLVASELQSLWGDAK